MNKTLLIGSLSVLCWGLACGTDPLFETEADSTITIGKSGTFASKKTFYMPPRIVELCMQLSSEPPERESLGGAGGGTNYSERQCFTPDTTIDQDILSAFEDNMEALGYQRVLVADEADLALTLGYVTMTGNLWDLSQVYCYPDAYFEGCVLPPTGDGVRAGPGGYIAHLIDLEQSTDGRLVPLWTAVIQRNNARGAVRAGDSVSEAEAPIMEAAVSEAFAQSPYLAEGGQ